MQQRFLLQILLLAQHVSGITMPHHQELKSIIQRLLRVVFCAVVFSSSWSGVKLRDMRPVCRMLVKYHTQQPLYNTLELLMMGIVMPETC